MEMVRGAAAERGLLAGVSIFADLDPASLAAMVNKYKPSIFLMGGTSLGMDLAPRVAAKVQTGLSAHAVDVDVDPKGCMVAFIPSFGGSVMASISCDKRRPQMSTMMP